VPTLQMISRIFHKCKSAVHGTPCHVPKMTPFRLFPGVFLYQTMERSLSTMSSRRHWLAQP